MASRYHLFGDKSWQMGIQKQFQPEPSKKIQKIVSVRFMTPLSSTNTVHKFYFEGKLILFPVPNFRVGFSV